jgi:hypothetical protein
MGGWFLAILVIGCAALGVLLPLNRAPAAERVEADRVQFEAQAQSRAAFEYLVSRYRARHTGFTGTVTIATLRTALPEAGALAAGEFPLAWSASVTPTTVTFCTPVPPRARAALLQKGYSLESLSC